MAADHVSPECLRSCRWRSGRPMSTRTLSHTRWKFRGEVEVPVDVPKSQAPGSGPTRSSMGAVHKRSAMCVVGPLALPSGCRTQTWPDCDVRDCSDRVRVRVGASWFQLSESDRVDDSDWRIALWLSWVGGGLFGATQGGFGRVECAVSSALLFRRALWRPEPSSQCCGEVCRCHPHARMG